MYDRVLLPTDGSPGTERAAEHAVDLASLADATLHVLFVVEGGSSLEGVSESVRADVEESMEAAGEAAISRVEKLAAEQGVTVEQEIRQGVAHEAILAYAEEVDADVIVMGTHGRTGLNRFLLGSVTERVIRLGDRPVLTVKLSDDPAAPTAEAAKERAREALAADGDPVATFVDEPYREPTTWIVPAETESGATVNVHVEIQSGDARIAHLD